MIPFSIKSEESSSIILNHLQLMNVRERCTRQKRVTVVKTRSYKCMNQHFKLLKLRCFLTRLSLRNWKKKVLQTLLMCSLIESALLKATPRFLTEDLMGKVEGLSCRVRVCERVSVTLLAMKLSALGRSQNRQKIYINKNWKLEISLNFEITSH